MTISNNNIIINNKIWGNRMSQELMRVVISLPDRLLGRFDEIIDKKGYSSRSEGIRDAIRDYIRYEEWMGEVSGDRIGIISIVFRCDRRWQVFQLLKVQQENSNLTISTVHKYLDMSNRMDVIIVKGDGKSIIDFAERMMAIKCVKHVKLTTIPVVDESH